MDGTGTWAVLRDLLFCFPGLGGVHLVLACKVWRFYFYYSETAWKMVRIHWSWGEGAFRLTGKPQWGLNILSEQHVLRKPCRKVFQSHLSLILENCSYNLIWSQGVWVIILKSFIYLSGWGSVNHVSGVLLKYISAINFWTALTILVRSHRWLIGTLTMCLKYLQSDPLRKFWPDRDELRIS